MNRDPSFSSIEKQRYYRLIALWAVCEGLVGGILHSLNLPVSGLINGGSAVIIICLIAWYVPASGSIIRATIIVAVFKMMLSPQSPVPAYFAVFFQGITGELFFSLTRTKKTGKPGNVFKMICMVFSALALIESAMQRIITMILLYGVDLWKAVNDFINGLTHQKTVTNYSWYIAVSYVALHLIAGVIAGIFAAQIPAKVDRWKAGLPSIDFYSLPDHISIRKEKNNRKLKTGLLIIWIVLLALWFQSAFKIGTPLLSSGLIVYLILRSVLIVLTWYFLISPIIIFFLKKWLAEEKIKSHAPISEILKLIPATRLLLQQSWEFSKDKRGISRVGKFMTSVFIYSLVEDGQ